MELTVYERRLIQKHKELIRETFAALSDELIADLMIRLGPEIPAARLCPECGGDTHVIDSRETPDCQVRRGRECLTCGTRFATIEVFDHIIADRPNRKK